MIITVVFIVTMVTSVMAGWGSEVHIREVNVKLSQCLTN
jgi:hypothetical protein